MAEILSPVDSPSEVIPLIEAGATELYGGVVPDSWLGREVPVNRRSFPEAQFADESSFAGAASLCRDRGVPLHLVLNAPFYHPLLQEDILRLAERAYGFGVHAFIVSDQGLLKRLAQRLPEAKLTLSTMAGALNAETVNYYRRFSIERVVLPRHLTLAEMGAIIKKAPGLQYEAFVLIGKCPNEEAYCTFQHTAPSKRWPCEIPYRYSSLEGSTLSPYNGAVARRMAFQRADRRMGCGLCAVEKLLEIGVGILKLVGRGGPTAGKIANVRLAAKYAKGQGGEDARADYSARFGRECSAEVCYFPELYWSLSEKEAVNGA